MALVQIRAYSRELNSYEISIIDKTFLDNIRTKTINSIYLFQFENKTKHCISIDF